MHPKRITYVSTRFGLRLFEKFFENTFPNVRSAFQHLRLGSLNLMRGEGDGATS